MQKQDLILIGGGGHCKSCIEVIEKSNQYNIVGIIDQENLIGTSILGYPVIGTDADLPNYKSESVSFLITVGQIKSALTRKKLFDLLERHEMKIATVISPTALVSKHAEIGKGTIVMNGVYINAAAQVGNNCILNTGCNIEHEATIGEHTHISTGAIVNGGCIVGNEVFIGSNATLANHILVTDRVTIGSGAVVIKNITENGTYIGHPAKKIIQ